jgi:ATP-dependent DNA ligase
VLGLRLPLGFLSVVFEGEVVAIGEDGLPVFSDLLKRKAHIAYFALDLLWLNRSRSTGVAIIGAKKMLRSILPQRSSYIG